MAILDGKHVDNSSIDPAKHKFIGMFRPPSPPEQTARGYCPGCLTATRGSSGPFQRVMFECWQLGHYDESQYVTI